MPDPTSKVLVTGSSGLIGGVVIRTPGDKYASSGLDQAPPADAPEHPDYDGLWRTRHVSSAMPPGQRRDVPHELRCAGEEPVQALAIR